MSLKALFEPEHVAVVGASRSPAKHGYRIVTGLLAHGFAGRISLVNPGGGEIQGLPCIDSISAAPGHVDCAIISIPADRVADAVRECADAGVSSVIVAATGFAEIGSDEGRARQEEIVSTARARDMRVLGPNTNGIFNASHRLSLGSNTSHAEPMEAGVISVASHSGALFNHFARRLRELGSGLSKFVPVGNEADVNLLDVLEYYIDDASTRVIGMIVEGIGDGLRFRALAERAAAAGKPIAVLKLGRSASGARSSLAHSSRLAGDARAYDALFARYRIASVPTVEALAGACAVLAERTTNTTRRDQRLLCIANSGAASAMLADLAERYGIPLAVDENREWPEPVLTAINALPALSPIRNPIDTGNFGGKRLLDDALRAIEDGGLDGPTLAFVHTVLLPGKVENEAKAIIARHQRTGSPAVVVTPGGLEDVFMDLYAKNGVPVFRDTLTAFESLRAHFATLPVTPAAVTGTEPVADVASAGMLLRAAAGGARAKFLSEVESAAVLRSIGVPLVETQTVTSVAQARAAAQRCGYPVVLKALVPGIAHKNEHGLVIVGIGDDRALRGAFETLERRVAASGASPADVTSILQPMLAAKAELIAGVSRQEGLGHFLIAGLGGIATEVLDVVTLVPIPATAATIHRMLDGSRLQAIVSRLTAAGGANDVWDEFVGVLVALSRLVAEDGDLIESIDINPLLIIDRGCVAVDALVVLQQSQEVPA